MKVNSHHGVFRGNIWKRTEHSNLMFHDLNHTWTPFIEKIDFSNTQFGQVEESFSEDEDFGDRESDSLQMLDFKAISLRVL